MAAGRGTPIGRDENDDDEIRARQICSIDGNLNQKITPLSDRV